MYNCVYFDQKQLESFEQSQFSEVIEVRKGHSSGRSHFYQKGVAAFLCRIITSRTTKLWTGIEFVRDDVGRFAEVFNRQLSLS